MTKTDYENAALAACFELHAQLLADDAFGGHVGTKTDFDRLFAEVFTIVRDELPDGADTAQIVETFYDYQMEIADGVRDADWYL